jgi:hypothetical protein
LRNRFDFSLKDEETFVVEVNATVTQQRGHSRKVGLLVVDVVLARVVPEGLAGNDELGIRNYRVTTTRLEAVSE